MYSIYAAPERKGEASNPNFERFRTDLGFTDMMVIPHWQYVCILTLHNENVAFSFRWLDDIGKNYFCLFVRILVIEYFLGDIPTILENEREKLE